MRLKWQNVGASPKVEDLEEKCSRQPESAGLILIALHKLQTKRKFKSKPPKESTRSVTCNVETKVQREEIATHGLIMLRLADGVGDG